MLSIGSHLIAENLLLWTICMYTVRHASIKTAVDLDAYNTFTQTAPASFNDREDQQHKHLFLGFLLKISPGEFSPASPASIFDGASEHRCNAQRGPG